VFCFELTDLFKICSQEHEHKHFFLSLFNC